jgi:hypothetical protein
MASNRIRRYVSQSAVNFAAQVEPATKRPTVAAAIPPGFVICPAQLLAVHGWQQEIYRLAYQRAQAATQIPRYHRRLFSVWN